ncbi:dynamin gtpase [Cordyceps javanica]|nr:dynamin gtpase [Cordyceps javanica]
MSRSLSAVQAEELHKSILGYAEAQGNTTTASALRAELNLGVDVFSAAKAHQYGQLLEKKWTTAARLEASIEELESQLNCVVPASKREDPASWIPASQPRFHLESHTDSVNCVAFHPVFSSLASGSDDCTIKIWDWELGELERTIKAHTQAVRDLDFGGPKGAILLASCSSDLVIKIWDPSNNYNNIRTLNGHEHAITSVRFLPCNASGKNLLGIKLWNANGKCLATLVGHDSWVSALVFHPGGKYIFSAADDKTLRFWDLNQKGQCMSVIRGVHEGFITCLRWIPVIKTVHGQDGDGARSAVALKSNATNAHFRCVIATGSMDKKSTLPNRSAAEDGHDDASVSSESAHSENNTDPTTTPATDPNNSPAKSVDRNKTGDEESLPEDPFDSAASRALFNAIDQFQSCGAGEIGDIPQLVIVGAQSVGKSSLLQSLTDIPFPVGENCCTRFATRIVSRRTAPNTPNQISISIEPPNFKAPQFDYPKNNAYMKFRKEKQSLTASEFADIIDEASANYLGIRPGKGRGRKNFAVEVLKIEVSGPSRSHFSILDIPGIFAYDYNVCDGEMDGVRNMVIEYMKQPESIVICVADAFVDLSNQEIFKLANEYVDKTRLIGVFTKCDRTNNMTSVVDVANGNVDDVGRLLHHGWFVVRNKTKADESNPDFDLQSAESALFSKQPWVNIRETRRGSGMLKKYLGTLLCEKIQAAFPGILDNLRRQLKEAQAKEEELGPARTSSHQRRAYLTELAQEYQVLAEKAVERPWLLHLESARVGQISRESNDSFSELMRKSGHAFAFQNHDLDIEGLTKRLDPMLHPKRERERSKSILSVPEGDEEEEADAVILDIIKREVKICSSTQLPGMVHPDVIQRLYQLQTILWHKKASEHVRNVAGTVIATAKELLNEVCPSSGSTSFLHGELLLVIRQFHDESLEKVLDKLEEYCDADYNNLLQTTDPNFIRHLQLLRCLRMVRTIQLANAIVTANEDTHTAEPLGHLLSEHCHHSAVDNIVNDVHDTLKVYYQSSLQSFIRHVTKTIVDGFVIDKDGPLFGLSPNYMYSLDEAEVNRLGGENREVVEEREKLSSRIATLRSVEKTARTAMATASQQA